MVVIVVKVAKLVTKLVVVVRVLVKKLVLRLALVTNASSDSIPSSKCSKCKRNASEDCNSKRRHRNDCIDACAVKLKPACAVNQVVSNANSNSNSHADADTYTDTDTVVKQNMTPRGHVRLNRTPGGTWPTTKPFGGN